MKRIATLFAVMMVAIAATAQQISVNEAMQRAAALRPAKQSPAKGSAAQQTLMPMLCHTAEDQGNTLYYAFNYPDGGFAIIGGDNVARPILGYSEEGTFSQEKMPDALKKMLEQFGKEISLAIKLQKTKGNAGSSLQNAKGATSTFGTLDAGEKKDLHVDLNTKWNQNYPYNSQLKSTRGTDNWFMTGCVATAGSQVMKYYKYPEKGTGSNEYTTKVLMPEDEENFDTTLTADFAESTYNWDLMRDTYSSEEELTEEEELAIGNLLRDVGVSVNMKYGVASRGGSGSSLTDLGMSLREHFGYDKSIDNNSREYYTTEEWDEMIQAELEAGRPVPYRGNSIVDGGHAFIIHGYNATDDTYEINWGWGGLYDGFYPITGVNALNYKDIVGEGFVNEQGMLRNVMPDKGGKAAVNVVLNSPIIFDNNSRQTRIENRANGGSFRVGRFSIFNEGYEDAEIDYGVECRNIETGKRYSLEGDRSLVIKPCTYTYFPTTFTIVKSTDVMEESGIYEVRPIYRVGSEGEWQYMPMQQAEALSTIVVNGGKNNPSKDITFFIDETTIQDGEKTQITHNEGYAGTVTYDSSDESVAKVNAQGVVTGVAPGKATIRVTGMAHGLYRTTTKSFDITVIEHSVNAVDMKIDKNTILIDQHCQISVTSDNYTGSVTYTSSDASIAVVTPEGKVYGIHPGTAYIMAKAEGTRIFHETTRFFDVTVNDTVALEEGPCFYEPVEASCNGLIVSGQPMYFTLPLMNNSDKEQPVMVYFRIFLNEWEPFSSAGYYGFSLLSANYKQTVSFDYSRYISALSGYIGFGDILKFEFYKDAALTQPYNMPSISMKICSTSPKIYTQDAGNYGTLMLALDNDVPEGLKAYECNGYANNDVLLKEVSTMKAFTPYILYGTPGEYTFNDPVSTGFDSVHGNGFLMGKIEGDVELSDYDYVPSKTRGVSSFACYKAGGTKLADRSAFITTDYTYLAPYVMLPKLEGEEQQTMVMGDADGDGKVTMHDANIVTSHYLGNCVKIDVDAADTNEDGKVTMTDANAIVNTKE